MWMVGLFLVAGLVVLPVALYGLHRLCLWLEERGLLYYKHKQPDSGAASCMVALQQYLEPATKHVHVVKEERRGKAETDAGGEDGPRDVSP